MHKMRLGRTELQVSRIGFGGIPIARPSENQAIKVIQRVLDLGITYFDTAHTYGTSEERLGKAIGDQRDQVVLATKTMARDRKTALEELEESLKKLNTDYIDLWQFHNPNKLEHFKQILGLGGAMEAAQEALDSGKIRHIGFTTHSLDMALKMTPSGYFETVMFPFNFLTTEVVDQLLSLAIKHDVGFIAMKPFAGGQLTDANLVIKYLLQFDNVLPIPGIEKIEEIEEIIKILNGCWELGQEESQDIERIRNEVGTRFCRRCGYCMPCPEGVSIQTLMVLQAFWNRFPPERFFSWDRMKDAVQSAEYCVECGECEEKCPYSLPIRDMIKESVEFYENASSQYSRKA